MRNPFAIHRLPVCCRCRKPFSTGVPKQACRNELIRIGDGWRASIPEDANRLPESGSGSSQLQTNIPVSFSGGNVNNIVGANTFYANGITGQGSITANVEAGHIWNGHETLTHVSQYLARPVRLE